MNTTSEIIPFWRPWFEGKNFSSDWTSRAFPAWIESLSYLKDAPLRILEIGPWEGRSTTFFLEFFPKSAITCVDVFMFGNEGAFDQNTASYGERVTKISSRSALALDKLGVPSPAEFDLIYIDGCHDRADVMIDSLLAWRLLRPGGVLIWDDYEIHTTVPEGMPIEQWAKPAIDVFREWYRDEIEDLHIGYQIIVRKTKASLAHNTAYVPEKSCPIEDALSIARPSPHFLSKAKREVSRVIGQIKTIF